MAHEPIESQHIELMEAIAGLLADSFKGYGFTLLVYDNDSSSGRMNYISNSNRDDVVIAMKEFIANHEGRMMPEAKV